MKRLPDFIIAGVRKCGTTWLHQCLSEHPQIYVPSMAKELFFFDRLWSRGPDWYAHQFRGATFSQICGEATPTYFTHPEAARRIQQVVPDVKLVFIFRNPIDRAISMYHHMVSVGETRLPFTEAVDKFPELIEEGFYDRYYNRYADVFGEHRIFSIILEDVRKDGEEALRPLFRFLGVDSEFVPPSLFEKAYERREARNSRLVSLVGKTTMYLRDSGLHIVVNAAKAAGVQRLFYRQNASKPESVPVDFIRNLKKNYLDDTRRFGKQIGRDMIKFWALDLQQ